MKIKSKFIYIILLILNTLILSAIAAEEITPALEEITLLANQDKNLLLIKAIEEDDFPKITSLLQQGVNPNWNDFKPLKIAFAKGNPEILDLLLSYDADPFVLLKLEIKKCIESDNLEGLIAMQKAGRLDFTNEEIAKKILFSKKYDFVKYALENISAEIISNFDLSELLTKAIQNFDVVNLLLENIPVEKIQHIEDLFCLGAEIGNKEMIRLLHEKRTDIKVPQNSQAYIAAYANNHVEIANLLIDYGINDAILPKAKIAKLIKEGKIEQLIAMFQTGEFDISKDETIRQIFLSREHVLIKYLFRKLPHLKNAFLIGIGYNQSRGESTRSLLRLLNRKLQKMKNVYHIDISLEIAQDEEMMQYFSGLVNPGASDTYPKHGKPFKINEMQKEKLLYNEKVYQQIVAMAKKYDIPYLGICAGAQHLLLKNDGYLQEVGYDGEVEIKLFPGTIPHFFFLNEHEKADILSSCKYENIVLEDAWVSHSFSGHIKNLGDEIKLGGVSIDDVPEAFSLGANKIGLQFHPEMSVKEAESEDLERYFQFLDNVFGMFEGYHRSMQYAKKMGIDKETAKSAIRKVNEQLVDHLEHCVNQPQSSWTSLWQQLKDYFSSNNADKPSKSKIWGKEQVVNFEPDVKSIALLPGITPEDIAITKIGNKHLVIYLKEKSGQIRFLDRYDSSYFKDLVRLEFADGTTIDLDPFQIKSDTSFSGDAFMGFDKSLFSK